ncbi:WD repeat-containing protein 75-like [Ptychodera flava]|uniref:WD repeat-containing protein 75-like n=1 Tax=Ptychodera flava TaxID=63121 RepID=UPI003969E100
MKVITSSLDGTIKQWDYNDGILLKTYTIWMSIYSIFSPVNSKNLFVILRETDTFREGSGEVRYCLKSFTLPKTAKQTVPIEQTTLVLQGLDNQQKKVAFGVNCEYAVAVNEKDLFIKFFEESEEDSRRHFEHNEGKFTCVACHPTEYCIATGDAVGHLTLWRNFHGSLKSLSKNKNHWHALKLEDVCFTAEGSYIFTVGHECTVVQWQYSTNSRDFLPRLGAPIHQVSCSPDNTFIATSHKDNAIHLLSNRSVVQTFQGLTRAFSQQLKTIPTGLTLDPRTKAVVMNGKPGHLQFYAMHNDKQLFNLDIVCQNYITPMKLDKPIIHTEVENAAFDCHGDWLATVERRDDGVTSMEMRLKFWQWDAERQSFILNTCVELPHQAKVTDLCMRPPNNKLETSPMAATTSLDKKFKIWTLVDDSDIYRENECWNCQSVGFYHDLPAVKAAFSTDGSLLAVAFQQIITLWDPDLNDLKMVLSPLPINQAIIRQMHFGNGASSQYLVVTSDNLLAVWNLLTCSVFWTVDVGADIVSLVKDPSTDYFAAITKTKVFVFKATEQEPKFTYRVKKASIMAAIFVPHAKERSGPDVLAWQQKSQLYLMDDLQQILTIRSEAEFLKLEKQKSIKLSNLQENLPLTPFSALLEKRERKGMKISGAVMHGTPSTAAVKQLLETPAHVLPSVSSLCSSFMKILLVPKSTNNSKEIEDDSDEERSEDEHTDSDESDMDVSEVRNEHAQEIDQSEGQQPTSVSEDMVYIRKVSKQSRSSFSWMKKYFSEVS